MSGSLDTPSEQAFAATYTAEPISVSAPLHVQSEAQTIRVLTWSHPSCECPKCRPELDDHAPPEWDGPS